MTTIPSVPQQSGPKDFPVEIVPTAARQHLTGFVALNIPSRWRLGGDWHNGSWFDTVPSRIDSYQITDERRFARLLDRLGPAGLRDARPGFAYLNHPAQHQRTKVWAATHERAVVEMAWAHLKTSSG